MQTIGKVPFRHEGGFKLDEIVQASSFVHPFQRDQLNRFRNESAKYRTG